MKKNGYSILESSFFIKKTCAVRYKPLFLVLLLNFNFVIVGVFRFFRVIKFIKIGLFCLLTIVFCLFSYAQSMNEREGLYQNAQKNIYSNPEKAITISEYLINNTTSASEKSKALHLKAEALMVKGQYVSVLNTLFECLNLNRDGEDMEQLITTNLLLGEFYRQLGISTKAEENIENAEDYLKSNDLKKEIKVRLNVYLSNVWASLLMDEGKYKEAQNILKNISSITDWEEITETDPYIAGKIYNQLSRAYLLDQQPDSAAHYAKTSLRISRQLGLSENFNAYAQLEMFKVHFYKKDFQLSLDLGAKLAGVVDKVSDNILKKNIHQLLADNYKEIGDNVNYQAHNLKYIELNDSVNSAQQKARDLILSLSEKEQKKTVKEEEVGINYMVTGVIVLAVLLLGGVLWYRHQTKLKYNYYKEYISKLKSKETLATVQEDIIPDPSSKTNQFIPEKTEQILLKKLQMFENGSSFIQKNLTLNSLAKDLETNTRYLSEIVNKHKQKNFNAYINELRINYIVKKLRTEPKFLNYKISYLAEECGFSSHTSFSTVFKSVTGISPKEFINFIKKESLVTDSK